MHDDRVLCNTLLVNRSLLLAVLAEIRTMLEKYTVAKYERVVKKSHFDWDDHSEPGNELIDLLYITADNDAQHRGAKYTSKIAKARDHLRGLETNMTRTAKNLWAILVERKRLVWAALDKESFEN